MEVNWTLLTYIFIGFFALSGFFRGWWKEALITAFLAVLVFFLQQPVVAKGFVDIINVTLAGIWGFLPDSLTVLLRDFLETGLGLSTTARGIQFNAASPATWFLFLVLFVGIATMIGRSGLRDYGQKGYAVRPVGGLLGALIGALNGFIIVNLVREYLAGTNLPGEPATAAIVQGGSANSFVIQATQVPRFGITDSFLPWIIIIIGVAVVIMAVRNRFVYSSQDGFRKISPKEPVGYKRY